MLRNADVTLSRPHGVVIDRGPSWPSTRNIGGVLTATCRSDAFRNKTSESAAIRSGSAVARVDETPSCANICSAKLRLSALGGANSTLAPGGGKESTGAVGAANGAAGGGKLAVLFGSR